MVVASSGLSPSSRMRIAVIHVPTRNAIASITPKELMGKPKGSQTMGYMGTSPGPQAKGPPLGRQIARLSRLFARQRQMEAGALARSALHPDPAAMGLGDLLHNRKAHPGSPSTVGTRPEALEDLEDAFMMAGMDAPPVVLHRHVMHVGLFAHIDLDPRLGVRPHVIERVAHEVREDLVEPDSIAQDKRRTLADLELHPLGLKARLDLGPQLQQGSARIDDGLARRGLADPRELEQIVDQRLHRSPGLLDAVEEVSAGVSKLIRMVLAQKAREAEEGDKGRAQVMGNAVDVALQVRVL